MIKYKSIENDRSYQRCNCHFKSTKNTHLDEKNKIKYLLKIVSKCLTSEFEIISN